MTSSEFRHKMMKMEIGEGTLLCDGIVDEGLADLKKIVDDSQDFIDTNISLFEQFRDIPQYTGIVVNNQLGQDNLFYDLNISGYENKSTESIDDELKPLYAALNTKLNKLLSDIKKTKQAIDLYNRKDNLEDNVKNNLKELLGGEFNDARFSADELLSMDITAIATAYGLDSEKLKQFLTARNKKDKSIDQVLSEVFGDRYNNLSDEEKQKFKETATYISDGFKKDKEELTQGKLGAAAESISLIKDAEKAQQEAIGVQTLDQNVQDNTEQQGNTENTNNGNNAQAASSTSQGGGTSNRAAVNIPETADVETNTLEMEEHKTELQEATKKTETLKNVEEEKINAEVQENENLKNAQELKDQADHDNKVAEEATNNNSTENNDVQETTTSDNNTDSVENTQVVTPTPVVEQVQQAVQPTQNNQQTQLSTTPSTTIPEIKEVISGVKTTDVANKLDSAKMVSSVTSNGTPLKPIKIDDTPTTETTSTAGNFIPPIAGVSTAAVAGIGAKLYMNKKDDKEKDKEEKHENKFFNEKIEQEEESKLNFSSKEDIIKLLDR